MKIFINTVTRLCQWFAVMGGLLLLALAVMTVVSIVGRFFFQLPIRGDFEYTKQGMGIVLAAFLPYCILHGGNLIVDFFTSKTSLKTQRVLDTIGAALTGLGLLLFALQGTRAIESFLESNEVSGNANIPIWWIYVGMAPSLWLAVFAAVVLSIKTWNGEHQESEAEAILREAQENKDLQAQDEALAPIGVKA